eukprot:PhM_4_TR4320/c0_g1_i1/m.35209/K00726/MGAT1; alpha-1,3-mannosyl-glycoprotein beta-1,2-N-acetylglucosaminyltransferase
MNFRRFSIVVLVIVLVLVLQNVILIQTVMSVLPSSGGTTLFAASSTADSYSMTNISTSSSSSSSSLLLGARIAHVDVAALLHQPHKTAQPTLAPTTPSPVVSVATATQSPVPTPSTTSSPPSTPPPQQHNRRTVRHYKDGEVPTGLVNLRDAAVVILCYNRPDYLSDTLKGMYRAAFASELAVYVSQDGHDEAVADMMRMWKKKRTITHMQHPQIPLAQLPYHASPSTQRLARHYKWALDKLFHEHNHTHVIILEDDMVISHDLFSFFEQTAPVMDADPTVWCVSSWNDFGFNTFDLPVDRLFRTSFFPGLGWMLRRELWLELGPKFPVDHWDHWMRVPTVNKNRDCVVPYLSRNHNIGVYGANVDETEYEMFLRNILHYEGHSLVPLGDLSYLKKDAYMSNLKQKIERANKVVTLQQYEDLRNPAGFSPDSVVLVPYVKENFVNLADVFGIYPTPKASFAHTITLHRFKATFILVNQRSSPLIPSKHRISASRGLKAIAAESAGMSCDEVCASRANMICGPQDFEFINHCRTLKEHFPCTAGCSREWGRDIPNYAVDPEDKKNFGKCLITEDVSSCDASHPSTKRLCPCIPG